MKELLKKIMKKTPIYHYFLAPWLTRRKEKKVILEWEKKGKPVPPPDVIKRRTIASYAKKFSLKILVETGTYYGDTIEAMKHLFERLYSIELSKELYEQATRRFQRDKHIELIYGDSGIELGNVLKRLQQPALFWLDGHYSGGITGKGGKNTPIYAELEYILNCQEKKHVMLIDDARCFGTLPDYPSIEELTHFIQTKRPDLNIDVEDDIIRVTPKQ